MKESKTIQVYPDDDIVNETIGEYESFGWEVINNQRMQEFEGTDSNGTKHYSTFNKITFSREKESTWYEAVTDLEREYNSAESTVKSYQRAKPVLKQVKPEGSVGVALGGLCFALWIIPGIIYVSVRAAKRSKYKKQYQKALAEYEAVYPAKIKELESKKAELRVRAEKCILGKA